MIGFCYNSKRVELYDPSQPRDESGKWSSSGISGANEKTAQKSEHTRIGSPDWGASKKNSYEMTGYSASLMGVEGFRHEKDWQTSPRLKKETEKILNAINEDNIGSEESTFHGFQNVKKTEYLNGQEVRLPLTATTSDTDEAEGFAIERLRQYQKGEPTVFHFPKGTKIAAYNINRKKEDIKTFGIYGEAITAGKFRVDKVSTKTISKWYEDSQKWEPLDIKIVTLKQGETFNVKNNSWEKPKINFYDPSQARDESGKWTGSGGGASIPSEPQAKHDEASKTPVVYHGTSAEVLKNIREKGLRASRSGVWGKGVYATSSVETALEYGALKSTSSARIMGKSLIGLIEVASSGFKKVSEYNADSKRHGRKASGVIEILLSDKDVPSSMIKSMKIFDAKAVRNWIFEGGEKPKPIATKNLQEGSIFVPIIIDEPINQNLEEKPCPLPTQDIKTNLKNRANAVKTASYGPANPKEPNEEFWNKMAKNFNTTSEEAKTMRCGNCAAFNKTSRLLNCIKKGIGEDAEEVAKAGDLGFCEFFDFKCAALRTCAAWVVGGPITDKKENKSDSVKEFFDPSQARDDSGKWTSQGSALKGSKSSENTPKTEDSERSGALADIAKSAKMAVNYGASKASDIKNWLNSPKGRDVQEAVNTALKSAFKGAIQGVRTAHDNRYKILVGSLINPQIGISIATASAIRGFVEGAISEYQSNQGGRSASNAIRSAIGIKKMSACGNMVKLDTDPDLKDVSDYITDSILVAIKEAYQKHGRFEITTFYDPSQERDESGKWTSGGAVTEPKVDAQRVSEIESNLKVSAYGPEPVRGKDEKEELKNWATSLAKNDYTPMEATQVVSGLKAYASANPLQVGGFRQVNKFLRGKDIPQMQLYGVYKTLSALQMAFQGGPKNKEDVVYRGSKSDAGAGNMNKSYTHNIAKYIKVGAILSNKGFFSATKSDSIADEFAGGMLKKSNPMITQSQIFMKLSKAKSKGISMPMFAGIGREKEVLFPEKTKIKVTKVNRIEHDTPAYWANKGVPKTYSTFIEGEIQ